MGTVSAFVPAREQVSGRGPETGGGPAVPPDKGYVVQQIRAGLYWVSDGAYNAMLAHYLGVRQLREGKELASVDSFRKALHVMIIGHVWFGPTTSGGEEIAKLALWAKVVKAIPPFAEVLHSGKTLVGNSPPGAFVCGDDAEARKVIASLVEDIGGAPVDVGLLNLARYTGRAAMPLVQLAYTRGFGSHIGLTLFRDTSQPAAKEAMP